MLYFYPVCLRPNERHGLIILEVSSSHTKEHHSRQDSSFRVTSSWQASPHEKTRHSQQTDIHGPGGIRTRNLSKQPAADLRFRARGHWVSAVNCIYPYKNNLLLSVLNYNSSPVLINCELMHRKDLRIPKRRIWMSINLHHVTSEKNEILPGTTLGNKQRERGVQTATGNSDNVPSKVSI